MRVLLVVTHKGRRRWRGLLPHHVQHGLSSIAAVLKRAGHVVRLLVVYGDTPPSAIDAALEAFAPAVAGFTAVYSEYRFALGVGQRLRRRWPEVLRVVGGVHVSLNPEQALADGWDAVCVGEGEYPMLELVERVAAGEPWHDIDNLCCRTSSGVTMNRVRPYLADLSRLPLADREMWDPWLRRSPRQMTMLLGRGCPFQCTYCCNHALKRLGSGRYERIRSAEHVLSEVATLSRRYPSLRSIRLEIETMGIFEETMFAIARQLRAFNRSRRRPLSFDINLRVVPRYDFAPLLRALRAANFTRVDIGLESGSERVRRECLRRHYSNDDVRRTVVAARAAGLRVSTYVLVGIPGERHADFLETERLLRELQPDHVAAYIVFPYPGTQMYRDARAQGLVAEAPELRSERARATLSTPEFPAALVQRCFDWLPYRVYRGHRPRASLLLQTVWRKAHRWFAAEYYG